METRLRLAADFQRTKLTEDLFHKKRPFSGPPQYLKLKRGLSCGPVIGWSVSKNAVDGSRDMVVLDYNNAESAEPYIYVSGGGGEGAFIIACARLTNQGIDADAR